VVRGGCPWASARDAAQKALLARFRVRRSHLVAQCTAFPGRVVAAAWAGRDEVRSILIRESCRGLGHDFLWATGRGSPWAKAAEARSAGWAHPGVPGWPPVRRLRDARQKAVLLLVRRGVLTQG